MIRTFLKMSGRGGRIAFPVFGMTVPAWVGVLLLMSADARTAPILPPPQDRGLPYTRSADKSALEKIRGGIAVFPGGRYGYVHGYRVRLSERDLLHGEAVLAEGKVFVPAEFAALVSERVPAPPPVPSDLAPIADRWVYRPSELRPTSAKSPVPDGVETRKIRGGTYCDIEAVARAAGLPVRRYPSGIVFLGSPAPEIADDPSGEAVVALFDTPDKFADPSIAVKFIPILAGQGPWSEHVKATAEQIAALDGPQTEWPTVPASEFDFRGFNQKLLGSGVPPPGTYPRLLFSPGDIPMLAERVKSTRIGQKSLIEMESLFRKSWWDPATDDGRIFDKLASGDLAGLEWDAVPGTPLNAYPQTFRGQTPGIHNSHVAYVPECLTAMAMYCLITGDDKLGRKVAAAVANYHRLREPLLDEWLTISDSEFGSSHRNPRGEVVDMNGQGARTHWRNIHGVVPNMNLALSLDFAGRWMTPDEKDLMRRVIAKATYGRRSYAQDAPVRFRDVNWMAWDLPHFLALTVIEGLPGFDAEAAASGAESVRAFCDWGIDDHGVIFESNGKTSGSLQFQLLSMIALARRGDNLFGHPHWRRLLEGQIQMTSPGGRVTVNSGTQYAPFSRQPLSLMLVNELKSFYPESRLPDYLITKATRIPGAKDDEILRNSPQDDFDPARYRTEVAGLRRLRLPSLTYPGFVNGVLYDSDIVPTTRADLGLPPDFNSPVQGVFSAYSDPSPEAAWMNLYVRPNHYLGAGHHHADAGMFHFSALGVDWFTQSPFHQAYDGKYFNLVQVDGESEPTSVPSSGILGWNGAADYLGARIGRDASVGGADLTYAYTWRWLTQPPRIWNDELRAMGWEIEPSERVQKIFAGTARCKIRPWWPTYTYSNFIPTCRALFNPMDYVFRSTGIVRGRHPYGFVVDDVKKDRAVRLYQWAAMLNGGVWKAAVDGLPENAIALAFDGRGADTGRPRPPIVPKPGDPLLLVYAPGMRESGDPERPLFQVETAEGPKDKKGEPQHFDRMVINRRDTEAGFRVLLVPVRSGDPLPELTVRPDGSVMLRQGTQRDELVFTGRAGKPTGIKILRGGESLLDTMSPQKRAEHGGSGLSAR
jgi:hypothetical protein